MEYAIDNARLHEFIAHKGLDAEFDAFVAEHDRRVADAGKPELNVPYTLMFRRSNGDETYGNVTPWLRDASLEDACRFARLAREEHDAYDPTDEDVRFLTGVVEPSMDEEERDRLYRAQGVRVMLYDVCELHAQIRKLLPDIRPADHEEVLSHLIPARGPMGPGDAQGVEEVGPLL